MVAHLDTIRPGSEGPLDINRDPRDGFPYFNTSLFATNAVGTPGTASHRSFHGPDMVNFDLVAVDGDFNCATFGRVIRAVPPRLAP